MREKRCIVCGNMMPYCRCALDREPRITTPKKPGGWDVRALPIDWPMSEPYAPGYGIGKRVKHLAEVVDNDVPELVPA